MRVTLLIAALAFVSLPQLALAQQPDAGSLEKRVELARKMHEIRPVKQQVDAAIDAYAAKLPEKDREPTRVALKNMLNYAALEKISVDAMTETYTEAELAAMVEYYSKPEAQTAGDKYTTYADKVYPEIGRMLDQALMRLRTGNSP